MGPSTFEFEVSGDGDCEKLIGPFHKERFSTFGKVRVEHPSTGETVRDVVHNIAGDLDSEPGAIMRFVDFVKSFIHRIFEVLQILALALGDSVNDVPSEG